MHISIYIQVVTVWWVLRTCPIRWLEERDTAELASSMEANRETQNQTNLSFNVYVTPQPTAMIFSQLFVRWSHARHTQQARLDLWQCDHYASSPFLRCASAQTSIATSHKSLPFLERSEMTLWHCRMCVTAMSHLEFTEGI